MLAHFGEPSPRLFLAKTAAPMVIAAAAINLVAWALLVWATHQADRISVGRQGDLVAFVLSELQTGIAHDQESATVWDDAVNAVQANSDSKWIDSNLGSWMHSYFGHDGAVVLDPQDKPIYTLVDGEINAPAAYELVRSSAEPLVAQLRNAMRNGAADNLSERVLSPGVSTIDVVGGHPSVTSVKPIISDTGDIQQEPGTEHLHIAIRYLDGSFVADLQRNYRLDALRFSKEHDPARAETSIPLKSGQGQTIGYFIWRPYLPGTKVFRQIAPALVALAIFGLGVITLLTFGLRRRALNLRSSEATVRHLAHHDLLTGLPNRVLFAERLGEAVHKAQQTGESIAVLYLDLDRFKEVNDTFGHPAGDDLLREFADRLRRLTRDGDTVARLGGDEFTVLFRHVQSDDAVLHICQRVIESARHPVEVAGTQVFVGVSIGVAIIPRDGFDPTELTRRADVAMYQAKTTGRSAFAIYDGQMDASINARRGLERDLRHAVETKSGLEVHYQPQYSADGARVNGVEALLRWTHPDRGLVSPEVFIPMAEESGLIEKLGEWVLREACTTACGWPIDAIAVNVSPLELRNPTYAMRVTNILMATGLTPRRLELEVTESVLADKGGEAEHNISALRELGVRFALDDFGTGFSSLGRLHTMAVDRIKIDRSFVQGFGKENGDEAIIRAIISLAQANGLKTTAEGVETTAQGTFLNNIGCDDLQGFLLSKPKPAWEIAKLFDAQAGNLASARAATVKLV